MRNTHTDSKYDECLEQLRQRLLIMVGRVEGMISQSVDALVRQDTKLARQTIETDSQVNRDEIEIDELCTLVLAKWQPMASDLRFILLALKMVVDLERIGDLAVNICERVLDLDDAPPLKPYVDIPKMGRMVQAMLKDAVDAFVDADAESAWDVINRDDDVDDLYNKVFMDFLDLMLHDEANVERGMHIQSVAKVLERMADHCTNLAEQVVYMVRGKDIRHIGKLDHR